MTAETLKDLLHRQPFEPFEVRMSNGDNYAVRHPEFAMLSKSNLVIVEPDSDRIAICPLLHIAGVHTDKAA